MRFNFSYLYFRCVDISALTALIPSHYFSVDVYFDPDTHRLFYFSNYDDVDVISPFRDFLFICRLTKFTSADALFRIFFSVLSYSYSIYIERHSPD